MRMCSTSRDLPGQVQAPTKMKIALLESASLQAAGKEGCESRSPLRRLTLIV